MSSVILYTRFKVWKWNRLFVHEYKLNGFIYTADLNLNLVLFMTKSWIYSVTCASITFISKITWNRKKYTDDLRSFPPQVILIEHTFASKTTVGISLYTTCTSLKLEQHFTLCASEQVKLVSVWMDVQRGHLMRCAHRTAFPATCYMSLRN